jgi:predicted nucleotidyltransferase
MGRVLRLGKSMNINQGKQLIPLLIDRLRQLDLARVILFGSYAYGTPTETSDIDLIVVLNRNDIPSSYKENSDLYLQVSRAIRDIRQQIPVDLIVHTQSMHKKFIELDSMFAKEVLQKGQVLYEANHEGVAR